MRTRRNSSVGNLDGLLLLGAMGGLAYLFYKSGGAGKLSTSLANTLVPQPAGLTVPSNYVVPGTGGQSVSDLIASGYTPDQVNAILAQANSETGMPVMVAAPAVSEGDWQQEEQYETQGGLSVAETGG